MKPLGSPFNQSPGAPAPNKPCRCSERGRAAGQAVRALVQGDVAAAAREASFIAISTVQDRAAIAQRIQSGAASLMRRLG